MLFAILGAFKRTRKSAFPVMACAIGYGSGKFWNEEWAEPILKFTWAKMYIQAPLHSLVCAVLFALVAVALLSLRSVAVFKSLLGLSLVLLCFPSMFILIAYGTLALLAMETLSFRCLRASWFLPS